MEFGEKLRALREKEGMTQQTLADQLYVTRQAVSRWEGGSRYPDLLMTRKIADIFEVSLDELVSGEEVARDMEKEKLLNAPLAGSIQTMLYAVAFSAYLINAFFSLLVLFAAPEGAGNGAGLYLRLSALILWMGKTLILGCGLYLAVVGRLSAKRTGTLIGLFYLLDMSYGIANGIVTQQYLVWWLNAFLLGAEAAAAYFFFHAKGRVTLAGIYLLAGMQLWGVWKIIFAVIREAETSEMLALSAIRILGMISFAILLLFQAHVLNRKRKAAEPL